MSIHDIEVVNNDFRRMKVQSGWLYNSWNHQIEDYNKEWVFVPKTN